MGPVITLAIIALVVGFGWRSMRREHGRVVDALKKAEASLDRRAPVTLEKDPETGVYRAPRRRG
ncbi:MAG: hypothetical protein K8F58_11865 [Bauldia sp.]|nr:hypothetical protein [Bauldia sp.]